MESIWSRTVKIPERKSLNGDMAAEAVVIGAGMAGILTAYMLERSGIRTVVLEADRIAGGQTRNTTAKLTSQHGMIYGKLTKTLGQGRARLYARAHESAILEYEKLIRENEIDCHFERLPSYLYSVCDRDALLHEAQAAARLGLPSCYQEKIGLPMSTVGAVCFERQAQFHPLEFIRAISGSLTVYERTRVRKVDGGRVITDKGVVTANSVIFTAHYPFVNVPGFYFTRQHQERSYVLACENAGDLGGMYYTIDKGGLSFRNYENLLLIGGGGHRTGKSRSGGKYCALERQMEQLFPQAKPVARWSAQDCMSHDDLPFMGRYSMIRPNWYVATGFKKWGMTTAMVSAILLRDLICGVENPYESLFTPKRLHLSAAGALMMDLGESAAGLIKGVVYGLDGRKDTKRCTHLGCGLSWNSDEETWECPCHGSRFDGNGGLLDDPAQENLR